jgi:hypothetical protein
MADKSMSEKLIDLYDWVSVVRVILSTIISNLATQPEQCTNCNGRFFVEVQNLEQQNRTDDDDGFDEVIVDVVNRPCERCSRIFEKIELIETELYENDDNPYRLMELLYHIKGYEYRPSQLEFELYIWFIHYRNLECNFKLVISSYLTAGYDANLIRSHISSFCNFYFYNEEDDIERYQNQRFQCKCILEPNVPHADLANLLSNLPNGMENPFNDFPTEIPSYYVTRNLAGCLTDLEYPIKHQDVVTVIIDDDIPYLEKLRMFCSMMELDVDIDNMYKIFQLHENGELEDEYTKQMISFQEIKKSHTDQNKIYDELFKMLMFDTSFCRTLMTTSHPLWIVFISNWK